ncbi:hypothetical protein Tco_0909615 [Tanacetum coccineum]|uniref:Reverse transcriptase zinc-binding domain-containing protein n=1 Tax=Tanacetum coccineum TaxID=301880 RepID=A0ABQ5CQG6_9ASTR
MTIDMTAYPTSKLTAILSSSDENSSVVSDIDDADCKVKDRRCCVDGIWGGNWSWRLTPRGRALDDLNSIVSTIGNLSLVDDMDDAWTWTWDAFGKFKVTSLAVTVQNSVISGCELGNHHLWNSLVPRKFDQLPQSASDLKEIWSWWGLARPTFFPPFSIKDIALGKIGSNNCSKLNKVLRVVFQCALWSVWKWRNKVVNAEQEAVDGVRHEDIFPFIQRITKDWISARLTSITPDWSCWIPNPFNMFI